MKLLLNCIIGLPELMLLKFIIGGPLKLLLNCIFGLPEFKFIIGGLLLNGIIGLNPELPELTLPKFIIFGWKLICPHPGENTYSSSSSNSKKFPTFAKIY